MSFQLVSLSIQWAAVTNICNLSVHKLRPGDIKVVAAVGDSLTVSVDVKFELLLCSGEIAKK